jgi:hypothetical protein
MLSLRTFGQDICKFTSSTAFKKVNKDNVDSADVSVLADGEDVVVGDAVSIGLAEEAGIDEELMMNEA